MVKNFKAISLFSGCGGSDLGIIGGFYFLGNKFKKLPVDIVYASDINEDSVETYNANFNQKAEVGDIKETKVTEIPDADLIIGGFPCQSFSTVNPTKNPFDDRAQLYKEMVRIIRSKQPKFFIAENVKGFALLQKGELLNKAKKEFESAGYNVFTKILNSADFGIPQKRERVIIVGIRKDINISFEFPEGKYSEFPEQGKLPWVGIDQVVESLENVDKKYYFSERAVEGMKRAKNNMKRGLAQSLDYPSLTITAHLAKVSLNSRDPVLLVDDQNEIYRRFTPEEAAGIQSFPETFTFVGSDTKVYRQIGEAVPPVLIWNIAYALTSQVR